MNDKQQTNQDKSAGETTLPEQSEQPQSTQVQESDGAIKLLAAVAGLSQGERERFIAAMSVLNEAEPTDEEIIEYLAAWCTAIPEALSDRDRYRLLAEARDRVQTDVEATFLDERMALIRRQNKPLAFEVAVVNYAYQAPAWTIIGGVGLIILVGRLIYDVGREIFRIWF
jgi:hypothetical protein